MPLPAIIFNSLFQKIFGYGAIIVLLVAVFGIYKCDKKRKGKAVIEHNDNKRDQAVQNSVENAESFSEIRKLENQRPVKIRAGEQTYFDKACLNEQARNCNKDKECLDSLNPNDCQTAIEELSKEEFHNRKIEALKKMRNNVKK